METLPWRDLSLNKNPIDKIWGVLVTQVKDSGRGVYISGRDFFGGAEKAGQ